MLSDDKSLIICDEKSCTHFIKNHQWGKIKAEGWYFSRDNTKARCPDHVPEWYKNWKARPHG